MPFLDDASAAVKRWLSLLGITDRVKVEIGKLESHVCASTWTNPDYLEALIVFNDPAVCGPYDLEEVAAHEVFHIPMAEFKTKPGTRERSAEERAVERFSRAFVAMWRGTPAFQRVKLAPKLRTLIGNSRRERHAIAARKRETMPENLMALLMSAGAAAERDDVPDEVKELLRQLAAAAVTGEAPAEGTEAPPVEAEVPPGEEEEAPPMRATLSPKARQALADAERDALEAASLAKRRLSLETTATRAALFDSAPDVFPAELPKRREIYANAPVGEIERYIASQRERPAAPPGAGSRQRTSLDTFREPPTGGGKLPAKNAGGFVVKGGN